MSAEDTPVGLPRAPWVLFASLCGGILFTALFFSAEIVGINVPFFVLVTVVVTVLLGRVQGLVLSRSALWFAAGAVILSVFMAFRRSEILLVFDSVCVVILLLFACASYRNEVIVKEGGIANLFLMPLRIFGFSLWLAKGVVAEARLSSKSHNIDKERWLPVFRGLLIALPILIIFGSFLASADENFADLLKGIISIDASTLEQLLWVLVVSWFGAGALYVTYAPDVAEQRWQAFLFGNQSPEMLSSLPALGSDQAGSAFRFGAVEVCTVLVCVLGMFLMFIYVQFFTLFGGDSNIATPGVTYSSHARAGFFQLLVVAALCFAMLLACRRYIAFSDKQDGLRRVFVVLNVGLIIAALIILFSAHTRMGIYEDAYGYTQKRLVTSVFMLWLGALFVWFMLSFVRAWSDRFNFNIGVCIMSVGFVLHLNVMNPDATIAKANIERYVATGKIDKHYMYLLSSDADQVLMNAPLLVQNMANRELQQQADLAAKRWRDRAIGRNYETRDWWNMQFNFSAYFAHVRALELIGPMQTEKKAAPE